MKKRKDYRLKRILSYIVVVATIVSMIPSIPIKAEKGEKYPYTLFAGSSDIGAITVNTDNFYINGNIATNGTVVTSGAMNIHGNKIENAGLEMLYISKKLDSIYFTGDNVELYQENYSCEKMNMEINTPVNAGGELKLIGNLNLKTGIKALEDISLTGEVINSKDSVVYSEKGNIVIDGTNVDMNGLLYAPYGVVEITAQCLNLNNIIIIADKIVLNCPNINANYSNRMGELVGIESEKDVKVYSFGEYNAEIHGIDIKWHTQYTNTDYEIWVSDDNVEYTLEGSVSDKMEYQYLITDEFEKRYFKVSFVTKYGRRVSAIPFAMKKSGDKYVVEFLDSDGDKLADFVELMYDTDINKADTDDDGLTDYEEICLTDTDPLKFSSVADGISDADADLDGDSLSNRDEIMFGTNPKKIDTDEDDLFDGDEVNVYGTDPVCLDTDEDGLKDGDEPHIKLDPTNPKTYGVPDAEYKVTQCISDDNEVFSKINTAENPFKLSMDITAAGYVEGNLAVAETTYSKAIQNDSILGIAPELIYTNENSIDNVTLKFEILPEYLENTLNLFPEEKELSGIKRYNIFKYFEELNMLLPIKTQFDVERNIVFTNVDDLGTYCVVDMELWLAGFDVPEEKYRTTSSLMSLSSGHKMAENFSKEDMRMVCSGMIEGKMPAVEEVVQDDEIILQEKAMLMSVRQKVDEAPVDVAFLLQTSGQLQKTFISQKNMIVNVMDSLTRKYGLGNVRFCIITYGQSGAEILKNNEEMWFVNSFAVREKLDKISYEYTDDFTDRGNAFQKLQNDVVFKANASKFIFQLMNGSTDVGAKYFDQINTCARLGINYSEFMLEGYEYADESYGALLAKVIASTNGMMETYSSYSGTQIFEHICTYVAPQEVEFDVIVPTGWKTILLNGMLDEKNGVNTDEDSLTDWEEVDTDKLYWETDGTLKLPTLQQCMGYTDKPYAEDGLLRFESEQKPIGLPSSDFERYLDYVRNDTYILPIHSDPTEEDTDGDGLLDGTPQKLEFSESITRVIAPSDPYPLKYTGSENLWKNHISEMNKNREGIPTNYLEDSHGMEVSVEKETADFLVEQLLSFHDDISENKLKIRNIALAIKEEIEEIEGSTEIGAYFLNFRLDEQRMAYHSQVDTWQRAFGYNDLYDDIFEIGSFMDKGRIEFEDDGKKYALWTWKGDYWNLQSGAEVGMYIINEELSGNTGEGEEHFDAVNFEVPMTLSLYNHPNKDEYINVFHWVPKDKQWWITGFNPDFTEPKPEEMVTIASVDLSEPERESLYEAIKDNVSYRDELERGHVFCDDDTKTIWIQWYNGGVK